MNTEHKGLVVLNQRRRRISFKIAEPKIKEYVIDFGLYDKSENRIITLSLFGEIELINLETKKKKILSRSSHKISLIRKLGRRENTRFLSTGENGQYVCIGVSICAQNDKMWIKTSRLILYLVKLNSLDLKASLDLRFQDIGYQMAFTYFGQFGKNLMFVGLSRKPQRSAHLYVYDEDVETLIELEDKRREHQQRSVCKLIRLGKELYYTGHKQYIFRIEEQRYHLS